MCIKSIVRLSFMAVIFSVNSLTFGLAAKADSIVTPKDIQPKGTFYEATVPDTLDLAERAKLSINVLTELLQS